MNIHSLALASRLWHDGCVGKPELIIDCNPEDLILRAHCSACPYTTFNLRGNTIEQKTRLRQMFDVHFQHAHKRENAKDAAK